MFKKYFAAALVVGFGLALAAEVAQAEAIVVYREIFTHEYGVGGTNSSTSLSEQGWYENEDDGSSTTETRHISSWTGSTDAFGVNANSPYPNLPTGNSSGYINNYHGATGIDYLYWTDEYNAGAIGDIQSIQWYQNNTASADVSHLAIRIGDDDWYASSSTFSGTSWSEKQITFDGASWRTLNFEQDIALSLGSSTTLPTSGNVTAFGLYSPNKSNSQRLDSYEITAVPEPSTLLLLGMGALALLLVRRRRRR